MLSVIHRVVRAMLRSPQTEVRIQQREPEQLSFDFPEHKVCCNYHRHGGDARIPCPARYECCVYHWRGGDPLTHCRE